MTLSCFDKAVQPSEIKAHYVLKVLLKVRCIGHNCRESFAYKSAEDESKLGSAMLISLLLRSRQS